MSGLLILMHLLLVFGIYSIRTSGLLIVSEVALPKRLFRAILERIGRLRQPQAGPG